jgi:hypothetical protein
MDGNFNKAVAGNRSGFLILHSPHGTGSSSKIFWMTVSLVFSPASAS